MPKPDAKNARRLIVEGKDDGAAIRALLRRHGADWDTPDPRLPYIETADSVEQALDGPALATEIKLPRSRLGIVVDADTDFQSRWTQARDALGRAGVTGLPAAPAVDGIIVPGPFPDQKVGLWLMPDNASVGMLETFLRTLVPHDDAVWPIAESSTADAIAAGARLRCAERDKGKLHAWLAWQDPPGRPFGTAITAEVLRHDGPLARSFVDWFDRLYEKS